MEIFELLQELCPRPGVSGSEESAAQKACELLSPYGEAEADPVTGSVFFQREDNADGRPTVLLDAHIDEIGLTVTDITPDGFLKAAPVGGIDRRMLLAAQVAVYGTASGETVRIGAVTASVPPHLNDDYSKAPRVDELLIDTGLGSEAGSLIARGDTVLFENSPRRLLGDRVTGKALDDRVGCAVLIRTAELLAGFDLDCNVMIMLSSQEEIGERGAKTGAYAVHPDEAIAVDVSFADTPDMKPTDCSPLGSGVMIGVSPSLSRRLSEDMIKTAQETGVPYTIEVMSGLTGTNADEISVSRRGVPTVTLSIPERNMHTPAEVISLEDAENTARLIAGYLKRNYGAAL